MKNKEDVVLTVLRRRRSHKLHTYLIQLLLHLTKPAHLKGQD